MFRNDTQITRNLCFENDQIGQTRLNVIVVQDDTGVSKLIEIRCWNLLRSMKRDIIPPQVIRHDEEDVRLGGRKGSNDQRKKCQHAELFPTLGQYCLLAGQLTVLDVALWRVPV